MVVVMVAGGGIIWINESYIAKQDDTANEKIPGFINHQLLWVLGSLYRM